MRDMLQPGRRLQAASGDECIVGALLGYGGQGAVYACRWNARDVALKWYHPHAATAEQRDVIEALVKEPKPDPRLLWPEELVRADDVPGFGYLMALLEPRYRPLTELMQGRIEIGSVPLIAACMGLAHAMRALHTRGFSYRDVNVRNAFIEPRTGDVLVCDNDNVSVNRAPWSGVSGTMEFMAPEIARGGRPGTLTDHHALAVLIFMLLHMGHPLIGRRALSIRSMDAAAQRLLLSREPVFIFDPVDRSNEAVEKAYDPTGEAGGNALAYWRIYPASLQQLFTRAFTVGLREPAARPTELELLRGLARLRDSHFLCRCGAGNYWDPSCNAATTPPRCWRCGLPPGRPMRLHVGRKVVVLNQGGYLHAHHLGGDGADFDYSTNLAAVVQHPSVPGRWGLRNLGREPWVAALTDTTVADVPPGRSAPLTAGTRIRFGRAEGVIEA